MSNENEIETIKSPFVTREKASSYTNMSPMIINADVIKIMHYFTGPARLSCRGNINSVLTNAIPTTITMRTMLDLIVFHIFYNLCFYQYYYCS